MAFSSSPDSTTKDSGTPGTDLPEGHTCRRMACFSPIKAGQDCASDSSTVVLGRHRHTRALDGTLYMMMGNGEAASANAR